MVVGQCPNASRNQIGWRYWSVLVGFGSSRFSIGWWNDRCPLHCQRRINLHNPGCKEKNEQKYLKKESSKHNLDLLVASNVFLDAINFLILTFLPSQFANINIHLLFYYFISRKLKFYAYIPVINSRKLMFLRLLLYYIQKFCEVGGLTSPKLSVYNWHNPNAHGFFLRFDPNLSMLSEVTW